MAAPALNDFLEAAREDNPGVSDEALKSYWDKTYGGTARPSAAPLPSLERFMLTAKEDNPGVPDENLKEYWQKEYGAHGATAKDQSPGVTDYVKAATAGALSGVGMIAQGGGELVARGVNAVADTNLRAMNPLQGAIDWLNQSQSPGAKQAQADTQITGDLFDPSTWSMGKNPKLSGLALQGLNAIGQFAPNLGIALATAGASVPMQLATGAIVGGVQALGGALDEERATYGKMSHEELLAGSSLYRELIAKNVPQGVAKNAVMEAAAIGGGMGNAIPSAGEGAFESFIVGALTRGKIKLPSLGTGIIGKTVAGAAGGGAMGGIEEAIEQIGQNVGSNLAVGGSRSITDDTLQQFVLGAIAEGTAGAGAAHLGKQAPAAAPVAKPDPALAILAAKSVDEAVAAALDAVKSPAEIHAQIAGKTEAAHQQRQALEQQQKDADYAAAEAERAAVHLKLPNPEFTLPDVDAAELAVRMQARAAETRTEAQTQAEASGATSTIAEKLKSARRVGETQSQYEARTKGVENAVQESGAEGVDVRQQAGDGEALAGRNAQGQAAGARAGEGDRQPAGVEEVAAPRGTSAETPVTTTTSTETASNARIFGKPVGDLTDAELRFAANSHRMSAHREVAQAEIARRQGATAAQAAPAETPPAQRTYTPEEGATELGRQLGLPMTVAEKHEVPTVARMTAGVVGKVFGKKIVFIKAGETGYDAEGKAKWGTDGAVLPNDPSTVYVNVNSNRKWQALIGHETTHALKRTNAKVYGELEAAVNSAVSDDAFTWAGEAYAERTKAIQNEEMVANVVGDQMHEPRFWLEVFKRTGDTNALARALFSSIDKMRSKLTGEGRADYNTREFIKDAKTVRSAVAKAYGSWQKSDEAKASSAEAAVQSKPAPPSRQRGYLLLGELPYAIKAALQNHAQAKARIAQAEAHRKFLKDEIRAVGYDKAVEREQARGDARLTEMKAGFESIKVAADEAREKIEAMHSDYMKPGGKVDQMFAEVERDVENRINQRIISMTEKGLSFIDGKKLRTTYPDGRMTYEMQEYYKLKPLQRNWDLDSSSGGGTAAERNVRAIREGAKYASPENANYSDVLQSKPADFTKFVEKLPRTEKGEIVGSGGKTTRDVWNLVQRMERLAREGEPHKGWYKESATEILKAFKGDKRAAEIFLQLIAITSANREVKANFTLAEKALVQYAQGEAVNVGSQQTNDKINDLLYFGIPWEGRKTNNFYRNLMQQIGGERSRETTQDMHMGLVGLGKKQLNDHEYVFMDRVTKFVAQRMGMSPIEAQAAVWVTQKARHTMRRYMEKGFHRGMSVQGMKRMALADAAMNYGTIAQKRWSMLGPEVSGFPSSREVRAQGSHVTAEVKPSTKLDIGAALSKLSMNRLQEYQKTAFARVFGDGGPGVLMRAFGLDRTQYRIVDGAGGYEAMMAPNAIVTLNADVATAEKIAKAWMFIFRQDAVPFFRADDKLLDDPKAAQSVKIRFAESLSNTTLRKVYESLRAQVHDGVGLTKLDHNVIAIVNFRGDDGKPFLMTDDAFYDKLKGAVTANDLGAKISGYGRFGAETSYPYHDWSEDPDGKGLLSAVAEGRPDLQTRLRRWSNIFGKFAEGRAREARRSAGVKPGDERALQSKPARRPDQAAGKSRENPFASASAAVAHDRADPPAKNRLGKCHLLTWHKVTSGDGLLQIIGVVNGWPSAPHPRAPIKTWHSVAYDPATGNIWEPTADRWYTLAVMKKAFGFEPVVSLGADETAKLGIKTGMATSQLQYSENVKELKGAESIWLQPGDYDADWKALGGDEAPLQSRPAEHSIAFTRASRGGSPKIEWVERPQRGTWVSQTADGRYTIEPDVEGYYSMVDGEILRWDSTRQAAIATLNDKLLEDIHDGVVKDPNASKNITLKHKPEDVARAVSGLKKLASVPGIFRLATSEAKELIKVLHDVDTDKVVSGVYPSGDGPEGITYSITFNNGKVAFVNEDFEFKTAFIDVATFDKGSQLGSFMYPAVFNWAKNAGLKVIVDPSGLTLTNTFRRTEQMLSAALKFGSTEFMSPNRSDNVDEQGLYGWNDDPKTQADQDHNLAILALTSMNNTLSKVPEAKDLRYNFATNRFMDEDGNAVGRKDFDAMAGEMDARQYGIGRSTIARAIFINSLINDKEGAAALAEGKLDANKLLAETEEEKVLALYSKPPPYVGTNPVAMAAARKAGLYREEKPFVQRVKEMMPTLYKRFRQGMIDQFAPIKELDIVSYMLARMSKATDGAVEAMFLYGKPFLDNGALNVDQKDGGLTKILQKLNGEHDRFIAWIAGNRAAQLKSEGRERLFDDAEIDWLKDLNSGQMKDGKDRRALYAEVHKEFNAYGKAVLDVAEQQGLIDHESRAVWEKDFYVPFYRNLEAEVSGPTVKSGLVSQQAFKRLKGGKEDLNDLLANTLQNWSHLLSAAMKNKAALSTMEAAVVAGAAIEVPSEYMGKQMQVGKVLKALDAGAERYFVLEDPFLIDAISSMESFSFGAVGKLFGAVKRWLTVGVTANPAFKIRNLLRDSISAIGVSELPYNPVSNVARAWADTAHSSQMRASALASGAIIRFGTQLEGSRAEYVRDLINAGVEPDSILDKEHKIVAMLKLAWDHYQEFGDRGENVNRIALYKQLRAEGKNHLEASYAARDMLDFSKQGTWRAIRFLVQTVPFFNARVQGLSKLGEAFKENPKRMGYVLGAVALASLALLFAYKDDDDWKKREDWDRDNFWWFKIGDKAFRIPKPFEIGAIGSFVERAFELGVSDEMTGKRFAARVGALLGDNLSLNPTPQLVKPLIELYANKDFFRGKPIETQGMEHLSKPERIGRSTSAAAQIAGKAGVVSPVQIDHLIRSYFGWLGTSATTILEYGIRPLAGMPERPAGSLKDAFLVGNFVESLPTNTSRYITDFYNSSVEIKEAYADWMHAIATKQPEKAKELREKNKDEIALHGAVTGTERTMAAYNKLEKIIEANTTMTPDEKRARLDRLDARKAEAAKRFSELVGKRWAANAARTQ